MQWYQMCQNQSLLYSINDEFEGWKKKADSTELEKNFEHKLVEIAEKYAFSEVMKTSYHLIFRNESQKLLIAWHNDHDASWSLDDEGFDIKVDLLDLYHQELISIQEMIELFELLNPIDLLTVKQQTAIRNIFEFCKENEDDQTYFKKPYTPEEYQNIYHNIWRNKKLRQKMVVRDFLAFLQFFN